MILNWQTTQAELDAALASGSPPGDPAVGAVLRANLHRTGTLYTRYYTPEVDAIRSADDAAYSLALAQWETQRPRTFASLDQVARDAEAEQVAANLAADKVAKQKLVDRLAVLPPSPSFPLTDEQKTDANAAIIGGPPLKKPNFVLVDDVFMPLTPDVATAFDGGRDAARRSLDARLAKVAKLPDVSAGTRAKAVDARVQLPKLDDAPPRTYRALFTSRIDLGGGSAFKNADGSIRFEKPTYATLQQLEAILISTLNGAQAWLNGAP